MGKTVTTGNKKEEKRPTQPGAYFKGFLQFVLINFTIIFIICTIGFINTEVIRPYGWDIRKWPAAAILGVFAILNVSLLFFLFIFLILSTM
jgi:hypothetical protein